MTPMSEKLCKEITEQSGGVCILGFSRGKDSLAAWLQLRKYFNRIIPFHCASIPGLSFAETSLRYYEEYFGTKIERMMSGGVSAAISNLVYQVPHDEPLIDSMEFMVYDNHIIAECLRHKYKAPKAWCAFGINLTDSIDRRIYVTKNQGRNPARRTFYPCFDWTKKMILQAIDEAGLKLPGDYLLASRTLAGTPTYRHMQRMREVFPEDYERVKKCFPLVEACLARMEWRAEAEIESH